MDQVHPNTSSGSDLKCSWMEIARVYDALSDKRDVNCLFRGLLRIDEPGQTIRHFCKGSTETTLLILGTGKPPKYGKSVYGGIFCESSAVEAR